MSATIIGKVKGGSSGKSFEVKWNSSDKCVYVSFSSWTQVGKASSASDAMKIAEAAAYNK